jgi:cell division protein FtsB
MILTRYSLYNFIRKNRISKATFIGYCVGISIIFYFVIISIFGEKGLIEYSSLEQQIATIEQKKADLKNKIRVKKEMIKGMNLESLDIDLVDEQSRKILGYVDKNEVVIYRQKDKNSKK